MLSTVGMVDLIDGQRQMSPRPLSNRIEPLLLPWLQGPDHAEKSPSMTFFYISSVYLNNLCSDGTLAALVYLLYLWQVRGLLVF